MARAAAAPTNPRRRARAAPAGRRRAQAGTTLHGALLLRSWSRKDPLWPEDYFNAALIAASVGVYAQAAEHMQCYLELLPNAPDAQAARDQIGMWQIKAKETK